MSAPLSVALTATRLRVVLGTMTFGKQVDLEGAKRILSVFASSNSVEERAKVELDTARVYQNGTTEEFIGLAFRDDPALRERYLVASKVKRIPSTSSSDDYVCLTPDSVRAQCAASLAALGTPTLDVLYLHAPDHETPIEDTLQAVNELYAAGSFLELGLSNYAAWQVAHVWHLSKARGWVLPTIYQGMYNAVTRDVERELLPCLRSFGLRFYAYNPLAGGMLTGKHASPDADTADTRFNVGNSLYRDRYWKPSVFAALEVIRSACEAEGVTMPAAALRWMMHHSALAPAAHDGIILGASSAPQLEQNLQAIAAGPLPETVVDAFDAGWLACKPDCVAYFR